ncbi:MAG: DUF3592 domain-containing protein [Euryarchaeota archaeon TMED192]|nr:MAG: DUF3592 domain-containing protein [Euryarchaeota archaeon TMED192]
MMSHVWPWSIMVDVIGVVLDILEIMLVLGIFGLIGGLIAFNGPRGLLKAIRNPPVIPVVGVRDMASWYTNILIPCTVLLIGIFLFSAGGIVNQLGTSDWNEVDAIVDYSGYDSSTSCDEYGNECTTSDWLVVHYTYTIDEFNYSGNRWSFVGNADGVSEDYPTGKPITVYVDPADDSESVMVRGFEGVLIEILAGMWFLVLIASILTAALVLWKIGFHLQPAANRKKALEAPRDGAKGLRGRFASSDFMRELREMKNFAGMVRRSQKDAFEGGERTLVTEIDGDPGSIVVRNLNDIMMPMSNMNENAKIYLDENGDNGRIIIFRMLGNIDGDDYLEAVEYIGSDMVNQRRINMDRNASDLLEFIEQALENANEEEKPWWV